jgi:hypothetical protein
MFTVDVTGQYGNSNISGEEISILNTEDGS